jgi:hypothetical protein
MSLAAIHDAIVALLEGVPNIGLVHGFERYATQADALRALFVTGGRLHGWTLTRDRTTATYRTNTQTERRHHFVLRGYYALDDSAASETTFQSLIESIEEVFRTDDTLGGTAEVAGPMQVVSVGHGLFAGVLCHFAELTIEAQELVT